MVVAVVAIVAATGGLAAAPAGAAATAATASTTAAGAGAAATAATAGATAAGAGAAATAATAGATAAGAGVAVESAVVAGDLAVMVTSGGTTVAVGATLATVGFLVLGAEVEPTSEQDGGINGIGGVGTSKVAVTYDCWKPVLGVTSTDPSTGMLLKDVVEDSRIKEVAVTHHTSGNESALPRIVLKNVWDEEFSIEYVEVELPDHTLAAHAVRIM